MHGYPTKNWPVWSVLRHLLACRGCGNCGATACWGTARTDVDPKAAGVGLEAMISFRLRTHERSAFASFREHVLQLREVVALYQLSGADDFMAHVAVRDGEHLRNVTMDGFAARPEIAHMETALLFGVDRRPFPIYDEER